MSTIDNSLLSEHLAVIQDRLRHPDDGQSTILAEIRGIKRPMARFMTSGFAQDNTIAERSNRVARMERRLELRDGE